MVIFFCVVVALIIRPVETNLPDPNDDQTDIPVETAEARLVDLFGVNNPPMAGPDEVELDDAEIVIGVEVDGIAHAYPISALTNVEEHLINTVIQNTPVSVCYCDHSDCITVFTDDGTEPLDIRIGGLKYLSSGAEMLLKINDEYMLQDAADIPFATMDYERIFFLPFELINC